ncbi:hypothetical protein RRG08_002617 [Elysia crispata]|uniref:Uncharacterized protein n=1 Tax=Elysia crispata TaxID=231223 RepID=A0AAE1CSI0_9GAST|nr:hypothetical protein RRG08_002617 [Elysia crispata]
MACLGDAVKCWTADTSCSHAVQSFPSEFSRSTETFRASSRIYNQQSFLPHSENESPITISMFDDLLFSAAPGEIEEVYVILSDWCK